MQLLPTDSDWMLQRFDRQRSVSLLKEDVPNEREMRLGRSARHSRVSPTRADQSCRLIARKAPEVERLERLEAFYLDLRAAEEGVGVVHVLVAAYQQVSQQRNI